MHICWFCFWIHSTIHLWGNVAHIFLLAIDKSGQLDTQQQYNGSIFSVNISLEKTFLNSGNCANGKV